MALRAGERVSGILVILGFFLAVFAPAIPGRAVDGLSDAERQRYAAAMALIQDGYFDRGLAMAQPGTHPLADKIVAWLDERKLLS